MAFTIVGDAAVLMGGVDKTRPAAVFTGGNTDDAYAIDALAAARTLANDTLGTVMAWIMPGDRTSTCAIVSFNDADVVEFIDFKIVAGKLTAACTDGTTPKWATAETTASVTTPHVWYHVALVQDGTAPKLYVNGVERDLTYTVTTDKTTWFSPLDGVDKGWIGASSIGGAGAVGEEFVGAITEVKYYNTALTARQILEASNDSHLTTGCIAYYRMNDLLDEATGGGTYSMVAVSDAYLTPAYNNFISKVRKFGAVAADFVGYYEYNGRASALVVNAA